MWERDVCVGERKLYVRYSSEHGLGSDGAEREAGSPKKQFLHQLLCVLLL